MISCNNAESMQIRERCALADGEETWNSGCGELVCRDRADSELLGLYHSPLTDFI